MRLCSIVIDGEARPALSDDAGVLPLPKAIAPGDLKALIGDPGSLKRARDFRDAAKPADWLPEESVTFAVPIAQPGKFICVGLNFRDHAAEGGHPIPEYPALFMRTATSVTAHGEPLIRPQASTRFDYEAELMVVIGSRCRHATEATALQAVFGYTVFNDGSVRDYQRKSGQWTAGKNFDASGAIGPAIVTKDELPDGADGLRVSCRVNGETLQDGNTSDMIFSVPRIIAILSEIMTLEPGDLIAMGTPAGVGFARKPPIWLKAGDLCEVEVEGVGRLSNVVEDEAPPSGGGAARP